MSDDSQAPQVTGPSPDSSTLANIVGQAPTQSPVLAGNGANGVASQDDQQIPQPTSRLTAILSAVAHVASVGLSAIPDKGRSSFITGLGNGARAQQADQANQQAIRFQSFQDSLRAANLHAQDLQKQQADAEQQKAQQAAEDFQHEAFTNNGGTYDTIPNNGTAVTQTLQADTQANGSSSIAPGAHVSANQTDIFSPTKNPQSLAAQVKGYQSLQGVLPGLPTLPAFDPSSVKTTADVAKARQDLGQHLDIMQHLLQGYNIDGSPLNHGQLKDLVPAYQAQIDSLTKTGNATPYQLGTLKNTLAILQANESNHQGAEDDAADAASQRKIAELNAVNDNKAGNTIDVNDAKPQKPAKAQNVDENNNPVWVPGATADEKKKAELAENMTFNANSVAGLLQRRPDLVGAVAGRFTTLDQMAGSNDKDIVQLGIDMHNMGMANAGIHGLRSLDAANDYGKVVLNNFKNGPQGIYGGLKSSVDSVQTFIDNARPNTYKTHSKNGGAIKAMVPQAQGQQ